MLGHGSTARTSDISLFEYIFQKIFSATARVARSSAFSCSGYDASGGEFTSDCTVVLQALKRERHFSVCTRVRAATVIYKTTVARIPREKRDRTAVYFRRYDGPRLSERRSNESSIASFIERAIVRTVRLRKIDAFLVQLRKLKKK